MRRWLWPGTLLLLAGAAFLAGWRTHTGEPAPDPRRWADAAAYVGRLQLQVSLSREALYERVVTGRTEDGGAPLPGLDALTAGVSWLREAGETESAEALLRYVRAAEVTPDRSRLAGQYAAADAALQALHGSQGRMQGAVAAAPERSPHPPPLKSGSAVQPRRRRGASQTRRPPWPRPAACSAAAP